MPPRRLDMIICNGGVLAPPFKAPEQTVDGLEKHWGINFLAHYHLITLLSPAIQAQPPDRDVRIIFTTCALYAVGNVNDHNISQPWKAVGTAKLALMMAAQDLQRQFDVYKRPDNAITNIRCFCVDPGLVRTPMSRTFLSFGSIWGLLVYIIMWPIWFLLLKNASEGAQTILHCAMSPIEYDRRGEDGWKTAGYYRDCREARYIIL
jgi:NAD(P)-dependent dehydrogenase (short-subunit alcohol dehydrogenase family)